MATGMTARPAPAKGLVPEGMRLRSDLTLGKVWTHFIVWLLVSVCTLGLGWIVVSGHFFKMLLNSTVVLDEHDNPVGHLICDYDVEADPASIALWVALSIVTLGVGLLFYSFRAGKLALSATKVVWD